MFVGDPDLPEVAQRHAGYRQAKQQLGIPSDDRLLLSVPFANDLARPLIEARIAQGIDFDGIFACSDPASADRYQRLANIGLAVPDDMPVVGYDDVELPAISTRP